MKPVVIGVGNRFRRDDGLGPFVIDILRNKSLPENIQLACVQEGIAILELWSQADLCILVDATQSGQVAGKIYRFEGLTSFVSKYFQNDTTHSFGLAYALMLGRTLNLMPRYMITYGVEGKCFDMGTGLSPEIESMAKYLAEIIIQDIKAFYYIK